MGSLRWSIVLPDNFSYMGYEFTQAMKRLTVLTKIVSHKYKCKRYWCGDSTGDNVAGTHYTSSSECSIPLNQRHAWNLVRFQAWNIKHKTSGIRVTWCFRPKNLSTRFPMVSFLTSDHRSLSDCAQSWYWFKNMYEFCSQQLITQSLFCYCYKILYNWCFTGRLLRLYSSNRVERVLLVEFY